MNQSKMKSTGVFFAAVLLVVLGTAGKANAAGSFGTPENGSCVRSKKVMKPQARLLHAAPQIYADAQIYSFVDCQDAMLNVRAEPVKTHVDFAQMRF